MYQFHTIFDSNKQRYAIKVREDGHVSFRNLTHSTTGLAVTAPQAKVLTKIVEKIKGLFESAAVPAEAGARALVVAKKAKVPAKKPGRPAKAAAKKPGRPAKKARA